MAWVKVPAEHHPIFRAALPKDPRLETLPMFGGLAAKVNGHFFAGLFGRSVVLDLPDGLREEVLALEGGGLFDPMGDGRRMSRKVMLPEAFMDEPDELRRWVKRAWDEALKRPEKSVEAKAPKKKSVTKKSAPAKSATKKSATQNSAPAKSAPAKSATQNSAPAKSATQNSAPAESATQNSAATSPRESAKESRARPTKKASPRRASSAKAAASRSRAR